MVVHLDYATARQNMIDGQVRPNGIIDQRLLAAMDTTPREHFVPQHLRSMAYVDEDIDLGQGRYLIEPVVTARMLQALALKPTDLVLEIGTGVGYTTALLAKLVNTVVTIDTSDELIDRAQTALEELALDNAVAMKSEMTAGYAQQAPYDAIIINGAVASLPTTICDQLGDNGRLVTVIRKTRGMGQLTLIKRIDKTTSDLVLYDAGTQVLTGFDAVPSFQF